MSTPFRFDHFCAEANHLFKDKIKILTKVMQMRYRVLNKQMSTASFSPMKKRTGLHTVCKMPLRLEQNDQKHFPVGKTSFHVLILIKRSLRWRLNDTDMIELKRDFSM